MIDEGIIDIATASGGGLPKDLVTVLGQDNWKAQLDELVAAGPAPDFALSEVHICAPIAHPGKILAAAGNYQAHIDEGGGARVDTSRRTPRVFSKPSTTLVGPDDPVVLPAVSQEVDWELELAIVIGREAKEVSVDRALDYVAGYAVFNDVSARSMNWGIENREVHDWDKFFDWLSGKWIDSFAPMGPWIVTSDEVPDPSALHLQLELNGEVWQSESTGAMIFDCRDLIAHCSRITTLQPGDVIATGTPAGCGVASGRFLQVGDVMVGTVEGLGTQRTHVIAP
jgi:2-keto-4-pentenoate hydratase/2-oxohepta-3-ene-1,7-dioic acid hydratase in catechol pathway